MAALLAGYGSGSDDDSSDGGGGGAGDVAPVRSPPSPAASAAVAAPARTTASGGDHRDGSAGVGAGGDTDSASEAASDPRKLLVTPHEVATLLPPAPAGRPAPAVVDKFRELGRLVREEGWSFSEALRRNHALANPRVMERVRDKIGIDDLGSNFPRRIYDPHGSSRSDMFAALRARQRRAEERRVAENASRAAVTFVPPRTATGAEVGAVAPAPALPTGVAAAAQAAAAQAAAQLAATMAAAGAGASAVPSAPSDTATSAPRKRVSKWGPQSDEGGADGAKRSRLG
mmetsp:Transcript_12444/g.43554  ORF Transcript_12444/g.43554 Transcript_12444/m.43554 type:complete len:287 (-) Transcript_12444:28-888(-)